MDAFFARNRLSAYLDGELGSAEAREVEAALARDPALQAELASMREATELLRTSGLAPLPADFAERLASRLGSEPMPIGWRRWVRQLRPENLMLAAAALLVVVYVGNHKSLPELEVPAEASVVAGKAFDNGPSEQEPAAEPEPEPEPEPDAAPTAAPSSRREADGILGNETMKRAPAPTVKPSSQGADLSVEAWQPEWEKEPASPAPDGSTRVEWTSPPPFRYRVVASNDLSLKKLSAIAKDLGGELQDSRGRPFAAFQLETGEARAVRVAVPAYNAATLAVRLRELGEVETLREEGNLLAEPNADVPVQIEIQY